MNVTRKEQRIIQRALNAWQASGELTPSDSQRLAHTLRVSPFDWRRLSRYAFWTALACVLIALGSLFADSELVAWLRAVVRRASGRASPVLEYQGLAMNPSAHTATFNGESLEFTAKEFQLLVLLMDHRNQVLSRQQIEEKLYGWNQEVASNAVEVHIHHVRKKLGSQCIRTLRGVGYQLGQLGQTAEESPA